MRRVNQSKIFRIAFRLVGGYIDWNYVISHLALVAAKTISEGSLNEGSILY
jgi:hypothetical protein